MNNVFSLVGRVALVTGGYGHLGAAMSEALYNAGATVFVAGRNIDRSTIFCNSIKNEDCNGRLIPIKMNIMCDDDIKFALSLIKKDYGQLDILINNAYSGATLDSSLKQKYADSYDGSMIATADITDMFMPLLKRSGVASIINISSMYGLSSPYPDVYKDFPQYHNPAFYGAAKAAIIQWTKYMACHLASDSIRVNSISPGAFPSKDVQNDSVSFIKELKERIPLKRIGEPKELQGVILFLASDLSSYITGQNIVVDGGWTAW